MSTLDKEKGLVILYNILVCDESAVLVLAAFVWTSITNYHAESPALVSAGQIELLPCSNSIP